MNTAFSIVLGHTGVLRLILANILMVAHSLIKNCLLAIRLCLDVYPTEA